MSDYYDLGAYGRSVSTSSDGAQLRFDRGLNWCYGFNHDESVRCALVVGRCGRSTRKGMST